MKKTIISMLLSMFLIHSHAQSGLPYKSLSDFKNDTTAFINYNFIDRAEQYIGKTVEFIVHDLQILVKYTFMNGMSGLRGLYLCFHEAGEMRRIRESTINKPYIINVNWERRIPETDDLVSWMISKEYNKVIIKELF